MKSVSGESGWVTEKDQFGIKTYTSLNQSPVKLNVLVVLPV